MAAQRESVSAHLTCRVLIIGCGLAGLAAAIGIRRAGHEVRILEKAAALQELGAGINVSPNGTLIFKEWGILDAIKDKANIPYAASMRSYKDSVELFSQPLGHQIEELYSAPYLVIHRADLHNVLVQEANRLGVTIHLKSQFKRINFSDPSVELCNEERYDADVILGADGERSACRDALLGYNIPSQDSGDHVFRITVKASDVALHKDLIHLVQPPCVNLWVGPGANAITYALKRDGLLNVVLTCAHDISTSVQHGPRRAEIQEVREAFGRWDKKFQTLLSLAQGCTKWTLLQTPEAPYWTHPDGKFCLLGDSAHAMLPYLGQGAALAFEDAAVLGTLFSKIQHTSQLPDILSIYERLRKPRTTALRSRSQAMRDVYAFDDGPLQQERDRQLQHHAPFDGFPNFLADPVLQRSMFNYNAIDEAEKAWNTYLNGEWPSTRGMWNVVPREAY